MWVPTSNNGENNKRYVLGFWSSQNYSRLSDCPITVWQHLVFFLSMYYNFFWTELFCQIHRMTSRIILKCLQWGGAILIYDIFHFSEQMFSKRMLIVFCHNQNLIRETPALNNWVFCVPKRVGIILWNGLIRRTPVTSFEKENTNYFCIFTNRVQTVSRIRQCFVSSDKQRK